MTLKKDSKHTIIGVDTDSRGCFCRLDFNENTKTISANFLFVPNKKQKVNGINRTFVDIEILVPELIKFTENTNDIRFWLEKQNAAPMQGVSSMFQFGNTYGMLQGVIAANLFYHGHLDIDKRMCYVRGVKWKGWYKIGNDKERARQKASEICKGKYDKVWKLKKNVSSAEAFLIGIYGKCLEETCTLEELLNKYEFVSDKRQ